MISTGKSSVKQSGCSLVVHPGVRSKHAGAAGCIATRRIKSCRLNVSFLSTEI